MLKNVMIRTRLVVIVAFLLLAAVLIGVGGLLGLNSVNASLKTVYEDRLLAVGQLDRVVRLANRHQLVLAKAPTGDPSSFGNRMDGIEKDMADADVVWTAYRDTYMTPEEKQIVADTHDNRTRFLAEGVKPAIAALRTSDVAQATSIVHGARDAAEALAYYAAISPALRLSFHDKLVRPQRGGLRRMCRTCTSRCLSQY
ncbi:Tar ligand binding domain-containing protein [Massilia cavernae]|uniref:Chemotaxis methyl-accepting receptor Tar-related ligand-binding domain-containing protein n=1 Tax=Massilia cavernae TaxID=2320864 RepID=A0A418Y595_9BURK|nr:Tar ligand binding domain-containing protein [Massilia cavernae]RJG21583.1 hypothetical protein D3872_06530 [Massilia cavernae]